MSGRAQALVDKNAAQRQEFVDEINEQYSELRDEFFAGLEDRRCGRGIGGPLPGVRLHTGCCLLGQGRLGGPWLPCRGGSECIRSGRALGVGGGGVGGPGTEVGARQARSRAAMRAC